MPYLSHLIIMAMLQINVREEKASPPPSPQKVDDNTIQKMMMSFTLCQLIHFFLHKRESPLAFFACKVF
jgi:hypothetical protein